MSNSQQPVGYGEVAARPKQGLHLTGDRKILTPGQAATMLTWEVPFPETFLVLIQIRDMDNPSSGTQATITLRTGVDRAQLDEETLNASGLSRAIVARSGSVSVRNGDPANSGSYVAAARLEVRSIIVPLALTVDPRLFGPTRGPNDVPAIDMLVDALSGTPRSASGAVAASVATVSFGTAQKGMTIYNDSASANLYIKLGSAVTTTDFTCRLVPGAYYETPFGWSGEVVGVWDAAIGQAQITRILS